MMVIDWNPLVNKRFNLEGDYGLEGGYRETIEYESGKTSEHLKNSYVPMEYPSVSLVLDNIRTIAKGTHDTELKQFKYWHDVSLRYGTLPFYAPRIGYSNETAVYQFIGAPQYDDTDGIVMASFGLREAAQVQGARETYDTVVLYDQSASKALPETNTVSNILQTVRNFLKWVKSLFDPVAGHKHTGEDAPQIESSGLADNAVETAKIKDGAVTHNKIADVTADTTPVKATFTNAVTSFFNFIKSVWQGITWLNAEVDKKAPIANPTFTGTPKVQSKTSAAGTDGTLIATEAQVSGALTTAKAYTDEAMLGTHEWLSAVRTKVLLPAPSTLSNKLNYLCRVIGEPNKPNADTGVWELIAKATAWTKYSDNADWIDELELAAKVKEHDESNAAHKIALAAETGNGTDVTTPAVESAAIGAVFKTIWGKIRQIVNVVAAEEKSRKNADQQLQDRITALSPQGLEEIAELLVSVPKTVASKLSAPPPAPWGHWACGDLPEIPDNPAGTVYRSDFSKGTDGWKPQHSTVSAEHGRLKMVVSGNDPHMVIDCSVRGKTVFFKLSGDYGVQFCLTGGDPYVYFRPGDGTLRDLGGGCFAAVIPDDRDYGSFRVDWQQDGAPAGTTAYLDWCYIGDASWLSPLIDNSGCGRHMVISGGLLPAKGPGGRSALCALGAGGALTEWPTECFYPKGDFTASLWIKHNGARDYSQIFFGNLQSGGFALRIDTDGRLRLQIRSEGEYSYVNVSADKFPAGKWHHIITKHISATKTALIKLNNVEEKRSVLPGAVQWPAARIPLAFGDPANSQTALDNYFHGLISDASVYDYATTDDEDTALYQLPSPKKVIGAETVVVDGGRTAAQAIQKVTADLTAPDGEHVRNGGAWAKPAEITDIPQFRLGIGGQELNGWGNGIVVMNTLRNAIFTRRHEAHEYYTQYPDTVTIFGNNVFSMMESPATLFGGTWTEIETDGNKKIYKKTA